MRRIVAFPAVLGVLLAPSALNAQAELVPLNVVDLAQRAGRIFVGECTAVREGVISGPSGGEIPYVEYEFAVSEALKGAVGSRAVVRHFGSLEPKRVGGLIALTHMPDMPKYRVGDELLLLLTPESPLGLTAPVGLGQGAFRVQREPDGTRRVVNGFNNVGLFKDVTIDMGALSLAEQKLLQIKKGPIFYDAFVAFLKRLAQ